MRIYHDLAAWYPLITAAHEYAGEADHLARLVAAEADGPAETLLDLGAGAGHMASHLKDRFRCTLADLSPEMLALSRALNPACEHVEGDMRTLRLGRSFDAVLAHDAIGYMASAADLGAAIATAAGHLRPGGIAVLIPDHIADGFAPATECGGFDAPDGRGLRYLEWTWDPDPDDDAITVDYALMLREPGGAIRLERDSHRMGLFDAATWRRLMADAGLEPVETQVPDPYADERTVFVGRKAG